MSDAAASPAPLGVPRFNCIEGIRAVLAWWVVMAHVLDFSGFDAKDLATLLRPLRQGILPVYVFMMISGFVIAHLVVTKRESYGVYAVRRIFRLMPLHLFVLLAVVSATLAGLHVSRVDPSHLLQRLLVEATLLNGVLPSAWEPAGWGALNTPDWSISVEMQFYLLAPLLLLPLLRGSRMAWLAALGYLALLAVSAMSYGRWLCPGPGLPCVRFPHPSILPIVAIYFAQGVATYLLLFRWQTISSGAFALLLLLLPLALPGDSLLPTLLWVITVALVKFPENIAGRFFASRPLVALGTVSYSTYLIHFPVVVFAADLAARLGYGGGSWDRVLVVGAMVFPVVLGLSFLVHRIVERPGIALGAAIVHRMQMRGSLAQASLVPADPLVRRAGRSSSTP